LVFEIELLSVSDPIVLGEVDSQGLQQAQRDGAVLVDIRLPNEWADTGVIEGAHTITAFLPNGRVHPEFLDSFQAVAPSPDMPGHAVLCQRRQDKQPWQRIDRTAWLHQRKSFEWRDR
jgi:rhodanese-related sulfurtransferase